MKRHASFVIAIVLAAGCRLGAPAMPRPDAEIIPTSDRMPSEVDPLLHVRLPPIDAGPDAPDGEAMVRGDVHTSTTERFRATPVLDGGAPEAGAGAHGGH